MNSEAVISVEGVSKAYRIWDSPSARLATPFWAGAARLWPAGSRPREWLQDRGSRHYRDFYALRDVSFSVSQGDSVGIIGRNGSGKSTLLQIIAGTLQPSAGSRRVEGRIAALLELGSGFNPEFTGRENVYLNGAILGFSAKEMDTRFEAIAAFADIGDFIEQPVKIYSSGMMVRLAFAVQTAVEPDILIVDEALSVGDFFFQQKCAVRMRALRERGTTLLFVSHDLATVRDLCQHAVYLRKGRLEFWGESQEAIARYYGEGQIPASAYAPDSALPPHDQDPFELPTAFWRHDPSSNGLKPAAEWLAVDFQDEQANSTTQFRMTSRLKVRAVFKAWQSGHYRAVIEIKNRHDHIVNSTSCYTAGLDAVHLDRGAICVFEVQVTLNLEAGRYSCQLILATNDPRPNRATRIDMTPWLGPLDINWDYEQDRAPFLGMFGPPTSVRFITPPAR